MVDGELLAGLDEQIKRSMPPTEFQTSPESFGLPPKDVSKYKNWLQRFYHSPNLSTEQRLFNRSLATIAWNSRPVECWISQCDKVVFLGLL